MTQLEIRILRDVFEGNRAGGDREHDEALVGLVHRGFIRYAPYRERQKFTLTADGRNALDRDVTQQFTGKPLLPWDAEKLR